MTRISFVDIPKFSKGFALYRHLSLCTDPVMVGDVKRVERVDNEVTFYIGEEMFPFGGEFPQGKIIGDLDLCAYVALVPGKGYNDKYEPVEFIARFECFESAEALARKYVPESEPRPLWQRAVLWARAQWQWFVIASGLTFLAWSFVA